MLLYLYLLLSSVCVSLILAKYSFETKPVPDITPSIRNYQNNPLMMTDKTALNFQLAQKYSKIQILMPLIPPLMIKKDCGFANWTMKATFY